MLRPGSVYHLGPVEHVFPQVTLKGSFTYTTRDQENHIELLRMLTDFDTLCETHNLEYQIAGSTLLGALRHRGFIPWQEDAEVEILQSDVSRLKTIFPRRSRWALQATERGYMISVPGTVTPCINISLIGYSRAEQRYLLADPERRKRYPQYRNKYSDLHPRQRYLFENITLWGPQQGQQLCCRRYGSSCLTVATAPSSDFKSWFSSLFKRNFRRSREDSREHSQEKTLT